MITKIKNHIFLFFLFSTKFLFSAEQTTCKIEGLGGTQPIEICITRDFLRAVQKSGNPETALIVA